MCRQSGPEREQNPKQFKETEKKTCSELLCIALFFCFSLSELHCRQCYEDKFISANSHPQQRCIVVHFQKIFFIFFYYFLSSFFIFCSFGVPRLGKCTKSHFTNSCSLCELVPGEAGWQKQNGKQNKMIFIFHFASHSIS